MPEALKAALKAEARRLGFDLVGVSAAVPFESERDYLARREAAGRGPHPFEHPEIAPRVEPEQLLPGARSIVAIGMSYAMPKPPEPDPADGPHGWLSMYCRGLDYHDMILDRLNALGRWLEAQVPGTRSLAHCDMGPPLDRAMAERAGIGRFGKSTLLIAPGFGTWTFLGELLTTADLLPDPPAAFSPCGSCTRCIDACPTQCLTPWEIDSQRCLGYINQMDGAIPMEFREVMGNRLFGCDDCQDICPYNRTAATGLHPEFTPREDLGAFPRLTDLMAMDAARFDEVFAPTAAAWRGQEAIQRNTLVALGNSGSPEALAPLLDAFASPSALLRLHAAWALGRLGHLCPDVAPQARSALHEARSTESDSTVLTEVSLALEALDCAEPISGVSPLAQDR